MIIAVEDLIYESNTVRIYNDNSFEISNRLTTYDYVEAVSFISKMITTNDIWDLKLPNNFLENINPINSIYWLSGGDEFWIDSKYDWCDYIDLYEKKFQNFKNDFNDCVYMRDIRNVIHNRYNLDIFYDYFLSML